MAERTTDYRTESNEATHALAREVAKYLDGWKYSLRLQKDMSGELRRAARLTGMHGACVYLTPVWNKPGRVKVGGEVPRHNGHSYGKTRPKDITVAVGRGAEAIAKEIARRFLPDYLPLYSAAVEEQRLADKAAADTKGCAERLAEALGEHVPGDPRNDDTYRFFLCASDEERLGRDFEVYGDLEVSAGARIEVKLRGLTEAEALGVLKVVGLLAPEAVQA